MPGSPMLCLRESPASGAQAAALGNRELWTAPEGWQLRIFRRRQYLPLVVEATCWLREALEGHGVGGRAASHYFGCAGSLGDEDLLEGKLHPACGGGLLGMNLVFSEDTVELEEVGWSPIVVV